MKNLKYYLAAALLGPASYGFAQNIDDALRFSRTQLGGTARAIGIGGATSAVGADLGGVLTNPAGLGLFQRSEVSFSPGLGFSNTDARAFGSSGTDSRGHLLINSFGAAFANRRPDADGSPWRGGTFSIGLTRINDYNQNLRYTGQPSFDQDILERLSFDQGSALDDMAFRAFLTERDSLGTYIPEDYERTGSLTQGETVEVTGGQTQFDFGYGTSYRDKLYLGGAIGIVTTRFNSISTLTAVDPAPPSSQPGTKFGSLSLREELRTRGTGVNARIGVIYRPIDALRIGASVQTPTFSQLTETYNASLDVTYDSPITIEGRTYTSGRGTPEPNPQDRAYTLTSPFRATGGAAVVIGKYGFLSADAEYVNYGQARLGNDNSNDVNNAPIDFGPDNDAMRRLYQSAVNVRFGGEARLDIFRLRLGFARYGDPYKNSSRFDRSQNFYTGGAGVRTKNFFLDLSGMYTTTKQFYTPYFIPGQSPVVDVDDTRFISTLTAGFLF